MYGDDGISLAHIYGQLVRVRIQYYGSDILQSTFAFDDSELRREIFVVYDILRFDEQRDDDDQSRGADENEEGIFQPVVKDVEPCIFKNPPDRNRDGRNAENDGSGTSGENRFGESETEIFRLLRDVFLFHGSIIAHEKGKIKQNVFASVFYRSAGR